MLQFNKSQANELKKYIAQTQNPGYKDYDEPEIDDYDDLFFQPFLWVVIFGSWLGLMLLWWMIRVIFDKCS